MENLLSQIEGMLFVIKQTKGGHRCKSFKIVLHKQKLRGFLTLSQIKNIYQDSYVDVNLNTTDYALHMPKQQCLVTANHVKDTMTVEYTIMPLQSEQAKAYLLQHKTLASAFLK